MSNKYGVFVHWRLIPHAATFVSVVLSLGGCQVGLDLARLPCDGTPCDLKRWVLMDISGCHHDPASWQVTIMPPGTCPIERRPLPDLSQPVADDTPTAPVAWSARAAKTVELAITDSTGELAIVVLGTSEPRQTMALGAVGVAWSRDGQRLAVVTRDANQPAGQAHQLLILTPELEELDRFPLDLPLSDRKRKIVHERFVVSWNADDTQVAVSTTAACVPEVAASVPEASACDVLVKPVCMLVNLADGQTHRLRLFDAYFVGSDALVATVPPASDGPFAPPLLQGRVFRIRLLGGQISEMRWLVGPQFALASDAAAGVFLAIGPVVATPNSALPNLSLRAADGTRKTTIGFFALSVHPDPRQAGELPPVLMPADSGLPALQQAGLAVGCP